MSRTKGAVNKNPYRRKTRKYVFLDRIWRSIRIMRHGFTVSTLLMTSVEEAATPAEFKKVRRLLRNLVVHGYIRAVCKRGFSRAGEFQVYAIIKDQVERPLFCDTCGQAINSKICDPSLLEKETKKKRKKETEKEEQEICGCEDVCHAPVEKAEEKAEVDHE